MKYAALVFTVSLFVATSALAAGGAETHDGFYLRLTTGLGYASSSVDAGGSTVKFSGLSGNTTLGVGWAIFNNFIINADIFGAKMTNPTVTQDGTDMGDAGGMSLMTYGLGIGVTYYFMPINIYLTGSVGPAWISAEQGGSSVDSKTGWGINAALGKEWWVSANWGLGLAGQFLYTKIPTNANASSDFGTLSAGLLFTATYN